MDWFLYDNGLRHERVKQGNASEYSQVASTRERSQKQYEHIQKIAA